MWTEEKNAAKRKRKIIDVSIGGGDFFHNSWNLIDEPQLGFRLVNGTQIWRSKVLLAHSQQDSKFRYLHYFGYSSCRKWKEKVLVCVCDTSLYTLYTHQKCGLKENKILTITILLWGLMLLKFNCATIFPQLQTWMCSIFFFCARSLTNTHTDTQPPTKRVISSLPLSNKAVFHAIEHILEMLQSISIYVFESMLLLLFFFSFDVVVFVVVVFFFPFIHFQSPAVSTFPFLFISLPSQAQVVPIPSCEYISIDMHWIYKYICICMEIHICQRLSKTVTATK